MNAINLINDEQLFNICLDLVALDETKFDGAAGIVLTHRAIQEVSSEFEEFSEEQISDKINEYLVDKIIENLVKMGEIEVDMNGEENVYRITRNDL